MHVHTHTRTHLSWWDSPVPCCVAGALVWFPLPSCMLIHMHAHRHTHTCMHKDTHSHTHLHVFKDRAVNQRWQVSGSMPSSANVALIAIPPLLESSMTSTWGPYGPHVEVISFLLKDLWKREQPSEAQCVEDTWTQFSLYSCVYAAQAYELAVGSWTQAHVEAGLVRMTAD